jgi:hypothetical protein
MNNITPNSSQSTFTHPAVEASIRQYSTDVQLFAELRGMEDGKLQEHITQSSYQVKVLTPIKLKMERVILTIKKHLLIVSETHNALIEERTAKEEIYQLERDCNSKRLQRAQLVTTLQQIAIDPLKLKLRRWITPIRCIGSVGEGVVTFLCFYISYPLPMALIFSMILMLIIGVGHVIYVPWIQRATPTNRKWRALSVIGVMAVISLVLTMLRTTAYADTISIAIPSNEVPASASTIVNPIPAALTTFLLFSLMMFLSLRVATSPEEIVAMEDYQSMKREIAAIDADIKALELKIEDKKGQSVARAQEAKARFEYYDSCRKTCRAIAKQGVSTYQLQYSRHHHDYIPDFFLPLPDFDYNDDIPLFTLPKKSVI